MKNTIITVLFAILFIACSQERNKLTITGIVSNYSKDYILFISDTTNVGLTTSIDTIKIDKEGSFNINPNTLSSNALLIIEHSKPIRLTIPNILKTPINIDIDCSVPDSIKVKGKQAKFVEFYLEQQKYWIEIYQNMSKKHIVLAKGNNQSPKYHMIQDTITQLRIQYLNKFFKDLNISGREQFIENERNSLVYSNLYYRMSGQKNEIIKRLAFYKKSNVKNVLTYSNEIDFSDENLFKNRYYQKFMNDFIMKAVRVENPNADFSSFELYLNKGLDVIDEWFQAPQTNGLQKIIFINDLISTAKTINESVRVNEFQTVLKNLRNDAYASDYIRLVENNLKQLDNSMLKFSPGTKAPDFELKDINGKVYGLPDFKDKIIIIDVWASWCKPCISSIPKWNDLNDKYSYNNNYQFISVSIDEDYNKWINGMDRFKPKGLLLYSGNKGFDSPFAKSFEIKGIPKYISIDKEGNIISISSSISDLKKNINKIGKQGK